MDAWVQMKYWLTLMLSKSFSLHIDNYAQITSPCSIALVAPFASLHWFTDGQGLKQWTGDDLKALMKVWQCITPRLCLHQSNIRFIYWQLKATFLQRWLEHSEHFWTFVT